MTTVTNSHKMKDYKPDTENIAMKHAVITARPRHKQQGAVLITSLVFLIILTMLAVTSMSTNTLEEKMAANAVENNLVFQAAESATPLVWNSFWLETDPDKFRPEALKNKTPDIITNFDGNDTNIEYSAVYEQQSAAQRCDGDTDPAQCSEAGQTSRQFYRVNTTARNSQTGVSASIHVGGYKWGPAAN